MERLRKVLIETAGLTNSEAGVYLALLKLGENKVGAIINESGLQSSVVHNSILSLVKKGIISFVLRNKVKYYSALDPVNVEQLILAKKDEFSGIVGDLRGLKVGGENVFPKVEVFSGKRGMMAASLKLANCSKKGEVYKYFGASQNNLNDSLLEFFEILDTKLKSSGIIVKGILKESSRSKLTGHKSSIFKFTKENVPPAMFIFRNQILLLRFIPDFLLY